MQINLNKREQIKIVTLKLLSRCCNIMYCKIFNDPIIIELNHKMAKQSKYKAFLQFLTDLSEM